MRRPSTTPLLIGAGALLWMQLCSHLKTLTRMSCLLRAEQRHIRDELRAHRVLLGIEQSEPAPHLHAVTE
jgi:hypothetical protein